MGRVLLIMLSSLPFSKFFVACIFVAFIVLQGFHTCGFFPLFLSSFVPLVGSLVSLFLQETKVHVCTKFKILPKNLHITTLFSVFYCVGAALLLPAFDVHL